MAAPPYSVEPFQAGTDIPSDIARIHLEIRQWQESTKQNIFIDILDSQADLKTLDTYYVSRGGNFFIAKDHEHRVIGFIGLRNDGNGHGVMKRLAVVPDWQRRGVGTALVTTAMLWAQQHGFTKLSLYTGITEKARPLYEKFGFKVLGFREVRRDCYMELNLSKVPQLIEE
jgi:GNAT superfamily N-acetyltransferase